jgi:poly-gamma-glutamate synthesis protein (capsule biosynthesis protein)
MTRTVIALPLIAILLFCCACSPPQIQGNAQLEFDEGVSDSPDGTSAKAETDATEQSAAPDEGHALLSFAGDCTLSNIQDAYDFNAVYDRQGPTYFLSGVYDVFANDDLTVVNLEGTFTNETTRADKGAPPVFWFRAPPEYVQILLDGSVEACSIANNHTLDYGYNGRDDTKTTLTEAGIDYFGYDDVLIREVNGIKVGFFGLAFNSDTETIHKLMDTLKADGAEVLIAFFHDGIEAQYAPSASQIAAAHTSIDYGASAVFISHPHVIQGTEEYNGGFIAYSLGNFCYGGHGNPNDKDSMIIQLELTRDAEGVECSPTIIPCSITSTPGTNDYRPTVLAGEEGQRVLDKIADMSL